MPCPKILINSNVALNILCFKRELLTMLVKQNYDVFVMCQASEKERSKISALGVHYLPIKLEPNNKNPFKDFKLILNYRRVFKKTAPDLIINYTIKPCIYGGFAASLLKIPYVTFITGRGSAFLSNRILKCFIVFLYRISQRKTKKIVFLNQSDAELFVKLKITTRTNTAIFPGEGVDTNYYLSNTPPPKDKVVFLFIGRLLRKKGIIQYTEAAKKIKQKFKNTTFLILGDYFPDNPDSISPSIMEEWEKENLVKYCGSTNDVRPYIEKASCLVLPTFYPEGLPRSLLEAMSMERPVITTDTPGCRELITDGVDGYICRAKDIDDLCHKMEKIIVIKHDELCKMGKLSKQKVFGRYSNELVLNKYEKFIAKTLRS